MANSIVKLERLERVSLREAWPHEAVNFTPWLAEDTNLAHLGETIGLRLELEGTERGVGAFAADILAKEVDTGRWVLIENQVEPTDHRHLGQLITYAAGLDARSVIWVAERFQDEHRAAIDFLNRATNEDYSFFGIEVQLFRIGQSALAPSFSVVAKPNGWSKKVQTRKEVAESQLSPSQALSKAFWTRLIFMAGTAYPALAARTPYKTSWQSAERLRSGSNLYAEANAAFTGTGRLRCEIYIGGLLAKNAFKKLFDRADEFESEFGSKLDWEELPQGQDARIAFYMPGIQKREDRSAWPTQHNWLLQYWLKLADVFRKPIAALNVEDLSQPADLTSSVVDA